jgi:clan AA aspartic protease (TIGR02281 family)
MAASIFIGLWPSALPASAEPNFDNGVEMYNKKDYRKAAVYFGQAIRLNPSDPNPIYYHALSCQALGDKPSAIRDYASIVSHFPGSQAGQLAATALQRLDPSYLRQLQRSSGAGGPPGSPTNGGSGQRMTSAHASMRNYGGGSSGGSSGGSEAGLPESSTVYFTPSQGENPLLMVPATINGRPLQMCFDTGAHGVVVGKNHLADMNIPAPSGPPTGQAGGVGSSSPSAVWDMNATVKVGEISRNIPVTVYESMSAPPLLGQNFFSAFTYEIDNGAHSIRFRKKSSGIYGGNYGTGVPFERDPHNPNHQIVTALVNGHPMKMFFDTGAQGVVFTFAQAKAAGLHIPEDATAETSMGVGGATAGVSFPIESLRMGPISKQNFRISVIQNATMPFPLMGQSFFNDYTTYVDESQNRILFKRAQ